MERHLGRKVGIFSNGDRFTQRLGAYLEEQQLAEFLFFSLDPVPEGFFLGAEGLYLAGVDLTQLDMVFVRGFFYQNPVLPNSGVDVDFAAWHLDYVVEQNRFSVFYSLLAELRRRGVRVVNDSVDFLDRFCLFDLLESVRDRGFLVPQLVCTNDARGVEGGVWRPVTGRSAWHRFGQQQRHELVHPNREPVLLAQIQPGALGLVYLLGGRPWLCLEVWPPQLEPDRERLERFRSLACGPLVETFGRLAGQFGLDWACVTVVFNQEGAWIYDLDLDPDLTFLPEVAQNFLVAPLARFLGGCLEEESPKEPLWEGFLERSGLFYSGQLWMGFELERGKWSR
ncbi:MAG: hypothetical protein H7832_06430 [Magnetococcus sp. DMHC-6]